MPPPDPSLVPLPAAGAPAARHAAAIARPGDQPPVPVPATAEVIRGQAVGRATPVAVTVVPGTEQHLRGTVILLIRSDDPPERVAAGMRAAVPDIYATGVIPATGEDVIAGEVTRRDGTRWRPTDAEWQHDHWLAGAERPSYVAEPVTIPGGQLLVIDYSATPQRLCRLTPAILGRHLERAGVRDAQIGLAPELSEQRYGILGSFTPVARGSMRAPGDRYPAGGFLGVPLAPRFLDLATHWLGGRYEPGMEMLDLVISTGVPVTWDNLRSVAEGVLASGGYTTLIVSDLATRAATAVLGTFAGRGISLAAAGAGWTPGQVAGQMRELRAIVREVAAEVDWAGVTAHAAARRAPNVYVPRMAPDESEVGPMWCQVLSGAQLARLGGPPPGAVELAGGRFELTIGEPEQWVPGHRDHDAVRARARYVLRS